MYYELEKQWQLNDIPAFHTKLFEIFIQDINPKR
jgi:hypothetical protein